MSPAVICLGQTTLDYHWLVRSLTDLPHGGGKCKADAFSQSGGGMATTAAVTVARLGLPVQFWGCAGLDQAGRDMRDELARWGVDVSHMRLFEGAESSVSAILVDAQGERLIVNSRGKGLPGAADWLPLWQVKAAKALLADPRWPAGAQALFAAGRAQGVPTVLDADVAEPATYAQLLPLTDHALFSEPGLAIWSAHNQTANASTQAQLQAVRRLGCQVAGVTLGARGVKWVDAQGFHVLKARPVKAIDTTGAGDVFHGAYAAALALGQATGQAFSFASAAAALKCQHGGGRQGIPDMAQTMAFNNSFKD